jgi:uncharacterized membrane protein YfcA
LIFFDTLVGIFPPVVLVALALILGVSGLMSGLSGFGFSAVGAFSLLFLPPKLGVPLLMSLSIVNQMLSLGQLKAELRPWRECWRQGPMSYIFGGLFGVPLGLSILHDLPTSKLMLLFGLFLLSYSSYSLLKPKKLKLVIKDGPVISGFVGLFGGVIGGFTAFPGAVVVVWSGLRDLPKREARSIVQPYILCLQIVSLLVLAVSRPSSFSPTYWALFVCGIPFVLFGTLAGVDLYRRLSDINFRRITFLLLGLSGFSLLVKAAYSVH